MICAALMLGFTTSAFIAGCQQRTATGPSSNTTSGKPAAADDSAATTDDGADTTEPTQSDGEPATSTDPVTQPTTDPETKPETEPESKAETDDPASEPKPSGDDSAANENPADRTAEVVIAAVDKSANPNIAPGDWPQWAGTPYRNNVPEATNIPTDWDIGKYDKESGTWVGQKNIKFVAELGSQSYGNAVVADGRIFSGTNNSAGYLKRYPYTVDLGCLLCFSEADGSFLWQHSSEKLPTGRVHDWELQGICCAPLVEGKRLWFVSSRGHVICLDTEGYYDGEDDGPVQKELARLFDVARPSDPDDPEAVDHLDPALTALGGNKLSDYMRAEFERVEMPLPEEVTIDADPNTKKWTFTATVNGSERNFIMRMEGPKLSVYKIVTPDDKHEADTIWSYDMMKEQGVSQHNMCSCSVTSFGDILFVNTSNGVDESHLNIPAPNAPSFMAMDKNTGEVHWTDKSPGTNILHGQWSSPTVAELGGVPQVLFAGGDGWLYSFKADKGQDGKPTLLWKFDCNPKTTKWIPGGKGTRNNIIATPVVYDGLVYVAVGQDPEHSDGQGHLWCIDPTKKLDGSDVSPQLAMKIEGGQRLPIPHKRVQAVLEEDGEVAVDNPDSAAIWHYSEFDENGDGKISFEETMRRTIGSVAIKDDILYIADISGLFHCLNAKTGIPYWTYDMFAESWGSPLIVDDKVYIGDSDGDIAIFPLTTEPESLIHELNMGRSVFSTPIVANGVLYISTQSHLFAIQEQTGEESE